MDEQVAGSVTLSLVLLSMLAVLAISFVPRWGPGSLLFAAAVVFVTVVVLVAATEGRRR